jgi:hypothetical protein
MHNILSTAIGVCLGAILTIISLWAITVVTQYICGNRYFTPSDHIVKKKLYERLKKQFGDEVTDVKSDHVDLTKLDHGNKVIKIDNPVVA